MPIVNLLTTLQNWFSIGNPGNNRRELLRSHRCRVLLLATATPWGGVEEHVVSLFRELRNNHDEVELAVDRDSEIATRLREEGLPFFTIPLSRFDSRGRRFRAKLRKPILYRLILILALLRLQRRLRFDTVIAHKFWDADIIANCKSLLRCKVILHECSHLPPPLEKLRAVDAIACMSQSVLDEVRRNGWPNAKSMFFPPLFSSVTNASRATGEEPRDEFLSRILQRPLLPGTRVVAVVANLVGYKGHHLLLDALASVNPEALGEVVVICAGYGPLREELLWRTKELRLEDRVFFPGFVRETATLIAHSRCLVLPSPNEAFGIVLLEAAMQGCPVIASQRGGAAKSLVIDGETGKLFDPAQPRTLLDCMRQILADDGLHARLVMNARKVVKDRFSISAGTARYRQIVKEVCHDSADLPENS